MKVTLINADVLSGLAMLPDESVHCCVTSPPYWGLRDYGTPGQIGLEKTPAEYLEKMVEVFREVKRVLRPDGTLWLNMGDSYSGSGGAGEWSKRKAGKQEYAGPQGNNPNRLCRNGLKPKDLCGMPWRLALALQADGWYLRSDIIWAKPNPLPESCTDRPTKAHEYIFLLTKSATYFYDAEAVREENTEAGRKRLEGKPVKLGGVKNSQREDRPWSGVEMNQVVGRNLRSVWTISTAPFPQAHFATFPPGLPERCIKAGTSERGCCPKCGSPWRRVVEKKRPPKECYTNTSKPESVSACGDHTVGFGQKYQNFLNENPPITTGWTPTCACDAGEPIPCIVLDPFSGAGTTCLVAAKLCRDSIGIELSPEYVQMSVKRLKGELGMLVEIVEVH